MPFKGMILNSKYINSIKKKHFDWQKCQRQKQTNSECDENNLIVYFIAYEKED